MKEYKIAKTIKKVVNCQVSVYVHICSGKKNPRGSEDLISLS